MSTQISASKNQIIRFKNNPVITTVQLAKFYNVTQKHIHDNFRNNSNRFVEGKHYFKLVGDDLKQFKNCPDLIGLVQKNTRSLILWTERGAARHAKMLDTDHAWEVFEQLEDSYFHQATKTLPQPQQFTPNQNTMYLPKAEGKYFIENKKDGTLIVRDANNVTVIRRRDLDVVKRDCQTIRQELELFLRQLDKMEKSLELDGELLPLLGQLSWRGI
ncbi:ORF6N domain-containing protein [Acinetobacter sp.]|uniref:ORF6N domain-containing protein n=1 Tax=Acinetobacter sp. TaxID=472 RepID=UPI002582D04B|nr:ORF6N domain-containing protein [Acinetobacter sp.]